MPADAPASEARHSVPPKVRARVFQFVRMCSHTPSTCVSSGEKTTPVAPSMDVLYDGTMPAKSATYTTSAAPPAASGGR